MTDNRKYVTYEELPTPTRTGGTGKNAKYDWAAHASYLKKHPGEWIRIESKIGIGAVSYVRTGKQPNMAELMPYLELVTRNEWRDSEGRRMAELIARYRPGVEARKRWRTLSDEQVRQLRFDLASGNGSGPVLAKKYGIAVSSVYALAKGHSRTKAGGPYGETPIERRRRLDQLIADGTITDTGENT